MTDRPRPEPIRRLSLARPHAAAGMPPASQPAPGRAGPSRPLRGSALLEDARGEDAGRDPIGISNDGREVWETGTVEALLRSSRG